MKSILLVLVSILLFQSVYAETLKFKASDGCSEEVTLNFDPQKISKEKLDQMMRLHPSHPSSLNTSQHRSVQQMETMKKEVPTELQENFDSIYQRSQLLDLIDTLEAKFSKQQKPEVFLDKKIINSPLNECVSVVEEFKKIPIAEQSYSRFMDQWHNCAIHQIPQHGEKEELKFEKNWEDFYRRFEIDAKSRNVDCD